jgi:hypothetical protein
MSLSCVRARVLVFVWACACAHACVVCYCLFRRAHTRVRRKHIRATSGCSICAAILHLIFCIFCTVNCTCAQRARAGLGCSDRLKCFAKTKRGPCSGGFSVSSQTPPRGVRAHVLDGTARHRACHGVRSFACFLRFLCVCMTQRVCLCLCVCVFVFVHVCMHARACVMCCLCVCARVCARACVHACVCVRAHSCVCDSSFARFYVYCV